MRRIERNSEIIFLTLLSSYSLRKSSNSFQIEVQYSYRLLSIWFIKTVIQLFLLSKLICKLSHHVKNIQSVLNLIQTQLKLVHCVMHIVQFATLCSICFAVRPISNEKRCTSRTYPQSALTFVMSTSKI